MFDAVYNIFRIQNRTVMHGHSLFQRQGDGRIVLVPLIRIHHGIFDHILIAAIVSNNAVEQSGSHKAGDHTAILCIADLLDITLHGNDQITF